MTYLIDTYGAPSDAELRMAGCVGCTRYVSHEPSKCVTAAQVKHIHSLNKTVVLNFEDSATNAKGGKAQGIADATFALSIARKIGAPKGCAIYFSVDYEIHSGFSTVDAYVKAARDVLKPAGYLTGVYGDYDLTRHLTTEKLCDFTWQTAAWSYGKRDTAAEFLQDVFTQGYDKDEINHAYYGGWTPNGPQRPPAPEPTDDNWSDNVNQDDLKKLIAEEIVKALRSYHLGEPRAYPYTHNLHPYLFPSTKNGGVDDRLKKGHL